MCGYNIPIICFAFLRCQNLILIMVRGSLLKVIEGFDYYISSNGSVYALDGAEISVRVDRGSYKTVRLYRNGKSHTCFVHRLKAEAFIPKLEGNNELNHLDGNKLNNSLSNYEWTTHAGNIKHAHSLGLIDKTKVSKQVIDTATGQIFPSIKEAAEQLGINYNTCRNYLSGANKNKTPLQYVN